MSEKGKKVLILGNGFDLAHGLPTKYIHFLKFCIRVDLLWRYDINNSNRALSKKNFQEKWIDKWDMEGSIKDYIVNAYGNRSFDGLPSQQNVKIEDDVLIELYALIHDNIWFHYFNSIYNKNRIKGENWIDFETEIRYIIQKIDETTDDLGAGLAATFQKAIEEDEKISWFIGYYVRRFGQKTLKECDANIRELRQIVFEDLEKIIRALELYLGKFVDGIQVNDRVPELANMKPDYVISFNYTNTYERLYNNKAAVFHIHGICDMNRPAEENNMVLGIDEYWDKDERDSHTNFTIFKKFAQRIQKHTGIENYKYLKEINKIYEDNKSHWSGNVDVNTTHPNGVSYVYIFGH